MALSHDPTSKTRHDRESDVFRRVVVRLGRRLREQRHERQWNVETAAERYGVEPAHVRRMESGRTNPSLATLLSVARALGIDLADLLGERPLRASARRDKAAIKSGRAASDSSGGRVALPATEPPIPRRTSRRRPPAPA